MLCAGHLARHSEHHWMNKTTIVQTIIVLHGDNEFRSPAVRDRRLPVLRYLEYSDLRFLYSFPTSATCFEHELHIPTSEHTLVSAVLQKGYVWQPDT